MQKDLGAQWHQRCLAFAIPAQAIPVAKLGPVAALKLVVSNPIALAVAIVAGLALSYWRPWVAETTSPQSALADNSDVYVELPINSNESSPASLTEGIAETGLDPSIHRETLEVAADLEGPSFRIRVLDAYTLEPAVNANVYFVDARTQDSQEYRAAKFGPRDWIWKRAEAFGSLFHTDKNGEVELPLEGDGCTVGVESNGRYAARGLGYIAEGDVAEVLLLPETSQLVEVRDQSGKPLAGVPVSFAETLGHLGHASSHVTLGNWAGEGLTDERGQILFEHIELAQQLDPSGACAFELVVPGFSISKASDFDKLGKETLILELPPTASLKVEVRDALGNPVGDGVQLHLNIADADAYAAASESPDSIFVFRKPQPTLTATVEGGIAEFPRVRPGKELALETGALGRGNRIVKIVQGPEDAGKTATVPFSLARAQSTISLHLKSTKEFDARSQGIDLGIWVQSAEGRSIGTRFTAAAEASNLLSFIVPTSLTQVPRILLRTSSSDGVGHLQLGFLSLRGDSISELGNNWEISHGEETLVAGQVLDQAGNPLKGQRLRMRLTVNKPIGNGAFFVNSYLETDEGGNFRILAPPAPENASYSIAPASQGGRETHPPFEFEPGEENGVFRLHGKAASPYDSYRNFEKSLGQSYVGRILVDDPEILDHVGLGLFHETKSSSGRSRSFRGGQLEARNGRFKGTWEDDKPYSLVVYDKALGVPLALQTLSPEEWLGDDGKIHFPDWDLRGKLFQHTLDVKAEDGAPVRGVSVRVEGKESVTTIRGNPSSTSTVISSVDSSRVLVSAHGYREVEVELVGHTEVILQ